MVTARHDQGDQELDRNQLVLDNIGLAHHLAHRYIDRGVDYDDLIGIAQAGLVAASRRYNPDRGVPFGAYAAQVILGELRTWFRDRVRMIGVPRRSLDLARKVQAATDELTSELGRTPTLAEIADSVHAEPDMVIAALEAAAATRTTPLDITDVSDRDHEEIENQVMINDLLSRLDPQEALVVRLRFYEELSQDEIATRVGVSQMQISRILKRVLTRLADETR